MSSGGVTFVEHQRTSPEPIGVQATAARVAWHQMTEPTLVLGSRRVSP
jgi:hypothetical protein